MTIKHLLGRQEGYDTVPASEVARNQGTRVPEAGSALPD